MSSGKPLHGSGSCHSTCPWCTEDIEQLSSSVRIALPDRRPPEHRPDDRGWNLHTDCAAEWREFVSHLRTIAGRGAFRTLVEGPLSGDVNDMLEWEFPDTS